MNSDINNNRDMYYSGYYGMAPFPNMNYPSTPNMNYSAGPNMNYSSIPNMNYSTGSNMGYDGNYSNNNYYNNIENRLDRIENQIKSINQRLTRLETPYNNSSNSNEPDNNMYIM